MSIDSSSKAALHKGYKHWCPEVEPREDWDKDFNFVLIRSIEELKKLDVEHKFVAWDTETSGLNPDIDWLVGFSFSFDGKTGYYVPVKHDDIALGKEALDIFHSILKKAGTQFLYNCRFDQRFFEAAGYSLEGLRYYDVMNAIWLADTNVLMPSLKVSERRFLGWIPKTFSETLGDTTTFQHVPAEDAYKYACLAEDTLVTTDQGQKKISEISVGTLVDTSEGFKEVTATYDNGIREVLEVSLDGNLIECTPDHLLAVNTVLGPSYMRADELLPCASGYRGTGEIRELRSTKSVRREVFQDFHLMYYLLGLAWADGWMNHEKNSLSFHSSVREQEFFTDFAKRFGTASVRVRKALCKSPSGSMVRGIDLTLISPHLEEFFTQHGYTCNKPSRVYKDIPDNYFSDFLRGLYDGDGSSNHHTMVFMCHEALKDVLVNDIHRLFGVLPTKSYFRHNVWSVSYGHSSSFLLWKSLYSTSSAFMQRKRDNAVCGKKRFLRVKDSSGVERVFHSVSEAAKFHHVCVSSLSHVAVGDRCHHKGICASYDTDFQSLLEIPEDIRCVVKPVGNRHVYDLQVKDVHNFRLANGIISHNCTDALGTYHLALISNQFYKESYPASKYDNDALYPMMRLENTPQRLDLEYLKSLCSSVETRIDESLQQVYQLAGCTFNVNSPAQFGKIMLERFGVDTGVRTPTGAMKADLKTLEAWMVKHGSKASPEVKEFLSAYKEYKKTVKFKSSYLDKYIKAAEDADTFPIRFSYKFQSVPCLTENNTVLTKSLGFVSIKDVQSEDMIWTSWGYKRVLWNHSHEVDEFYRVTLKNGMTLEGTGHHPVLVRKSPLEKVACSGMTKDDVEWAGIQDLKPDEPVVINHTHASLSCQDSWRSSLARIVGYFYGKGKMTDGVLLSLCFDNKDLAYHYYGWMKSLFGDKKVSRYDVDKGKVEYSITRQTLTKFLSEHDVIPTVEEDHFGNLKVSPVSTYTKVADRLSRMPDTFRHFLTGYLDSAKTSVRELGYKEIPDDWEDGITKDRVVFVIPSACKDVIIPMLWASAIDCKVTDHTFKTWFGEGKVARVEVSDPYSLSNLLSLWNTGDVGRARFSCVELPKTFRLYSESMVQSVEHVHANTVVYDIEVEDVHEFVAGGIVTHNTGRLSCLSHDALVHTRQGLVPIVDITEEHDIEVSPNKFAKAKLVHTGEQDFVKIVMSSGKEIECTTDHRFLCPSDEGFVWRYARDLKVSDMLCRTREYEIYSESIISIEPCGKKEAYTLAVDDSLHRYIAEGFIHHNCGGDKKNSFFTQNNVQCLEEDTSVITSEGIKPIKQVNTGDLVWTGSEFAPCQQLGSKTCSVLKISTDCGEVICSAEHLILVSDSRHEIGEFRHAGDLKVGQFMKHVGKVLSSDDRYSPSRIECIESAGEAVCYDLFVPKFERFVANGFIVHNSTPKPHSLMVKGRKATQEEINQGKDILGWYLSNDIPDDETVGLVEGMDPDHFNLRRAFLPKDDDCYVVSIDMKAEELRLVANIYNEKTWADAFIHGKDVHKACYSPDTEFLVLDRGWMTADRITKGMKIAYYDPMDDEVRFAKAGERYSHEASEVYMHPTLFNVTDNHRMWIGTQDAGFRIVRASELKSQGSPKQKFRMKTAVGQRKSFQSIESHFGRKLGQYFCYGFMYFAPHYYDEEGFVHITLDSPCTKIPHDFALFLHSGDFSSTEFSVDRELSLGLRSLEAPNPCTYLFSLAKTKYKDEPIFLQDFVYGMLVYLSSTKFNTLNLGDGSKVSGKVVVSSKEHADAIQWLLMLTGSTCRVSKTKSSVYGEGAYVLTIFSDVSSLPKSLGSTFGSVKQKNLAEKHLTYSCFSVPSGLLVTRYKGQITVNGNTAIKLFGEENYSKEARKKAKCLSSETLVQTSYGVLTLRSLYDGWKSGTYREDLKIATPSGMHHVLDVMNNGTKDVLCLNMSNGDTLEATPDHLVRSGNKWVPVSSLNEGDCIDADICLSEVKVYPQIPLSFVSGCFIPLNKDLAYLFGAVLGDGTIQHKNVYYFSEDEELLSEIERIVKGLGFEPRRNLHRIGKNGKPFFRISCGASRCREIFVGAGLVGDTGHKLLCVPDVIFKSPSECRFSFLQGIFDTDGTVSKLGNATSCGLCFCTSSQVFAQQCAMLCRSLGMMCLVSSDFNKTYNRTYYKVRIRASSVRQFVSLGGFKCIHKQNTLMEWLDAGLCLKTYKKHYCIQSISSGVREVFDVSVDSEEHAFLANGLVVHNCASFGILYGSGAQGFNSSFPEMSLDECRQFLAKFKEALPSIEQGQAENVAYAREHGTINTGYGRQRRVRSYFQSGDRAQVAFAERTVKNSVVQGTAADVLKLIFCRLWANVFKPYPDVTFMSTIHDEVNFSMPKRLAREVIPICMECMTIRRDDWPVTLECSLSIGRDSLGDLIPFTYNKETKEFTPEWEESGEVLKKRTGHVETKPSDNDALDVEECEDPYFGLPPEACEF